MNKITALLFSAGITASSLTAQSTPNHQLWSDPSFQKEFLGSYGFLAGAEPQISDEEKEALRNLIDLIKASPKAAIQALEPQITQSSSAAFDFILGNLYFQDGNLSKAEQYYGNAIVKHPDFRRAYKNLGLVQVQQGDFDKAIKTISKALELGEVDGRSYGLLGYGYLTQERYYPAEAAYRQAILMQPEVTDWKVGLARCLLETERYADAIALFDTLLLDEPNNADYWMLQGNAYLGKGEPLAAAKNLEIVRRMGAADLSTLTLLGDIYMNNNSPDLALEAYLAATELANASDSKALLRAAELLTRSGNFDQSKSIIAKIREKLDLPESDELTLLTLEAKIARAEGDDEAAVKLLSQIVERDSLNGDALIELANFYADQGDMAKAINRYEQAEKIEAFEREALVAHAQARVRNGDYKEALPLLRRALKLKSDSNLEDYAQRVEKAARSQG
ncbi:tetratricopeptide repeat protein [Coraliomargarita algicola]|uniref:Tetratricopeptide repeat protein n=1 Tax=Coraliomargarita algicola TaxID=3092156 RepID=A0ABZ0RG49_9BACT|nr:tetratricopeptide repeat protein [Coraliomargarita sp. J2-16]WPJ94194.1 tetratricopeptide repeat protein [Coraliomargarita sp. J2-16]